MVAVRRETRIFKYILRKLLYSNFFLSQTLLLHYNIRWASSLSVLPPLTSSLPFPPFLQLHLSSISNISSSLPPSFFSLFQFLSSFYLILRPPDYSCLSFMREVMNSGYVVVVVPETSRPRRPSKFLPLTIIISKEWSTRFKG